jgi:hypothetical protein
MTAPNIVQMCTCSTACGWYKSPEGVESVRNGHKQFGFVHIEVGYRPLARNEGWFRDWIGGRGSMRGCTRYALCAAYHHACSLFLFFLARAIFTQQKIRTTMMTGNIDEGDGIQWLLERTYSGKR